MSKRKKYVYIQKGQTDIWDNLILGDIYEIEKNVNWYADIYPYFIPKHDIHLEISELSRRFIPLETWREQRIDKILEK